MQKLPAPEVLVDSATETDRNSAAALAPRPREVTNTLVLLWVQTVFCAFQLLVGPLLWGHASSVMGLGPKLAMVSVYGVFALHFTFGHAKARWPYATFVFLVLGLCFLALSEGLSWDNALTGLSVLISSASLYGVMSTEMGGWMRSCAERLGYPPATAGLRSAERMEQAVSVVHTRRRKSATLALLCGLAWLVAAGLSLALVALTGQARAVAVAQFVLAPLALAGVVCVLASLWKFIRVARK